MSSKKMKKTLQDIDTLEKEMKKKIIKLESGTSKDDDSSDRSNNDISNGVISEPRKKKENINKEVKEKKKIKKDINKNHNNDIVPLTDKTKQDDENTKENTAEETIDWPEKDLSELFRRMEAAIPEKDTLAFGTRVEKLDWESIAFKDYTVEECKKTWYLVQKRLRRFRILHELLGDAREWISKPWTNFYRGSKTKRHPDMPRRPLSTYMLFYLKKKDKILAENPGMEMTDISKKIAQMYKMISAEKREKYAKLAAEGRKEYEAKLEEFFLKYPDIPRNIEKTSHHKTIVEPGPKKPSTPFGLYYVGQLKKIENPGDLDKSTFKEQCKIQWKNMSDKKKVVWIDWALEEEAKYQEELKNYISQNPDFMPSASKPVLTKEEKLIKERVAGKPIKPPNSAYSLFSRMMLQSEEIKRVSPKNRMNVIANQWKACSEEEKKQYRERANHMMEQYKLDFASYLESLTEEKRKEELQNNLPKRKIRTTSTSENTEKNRKRKRKHTDKDDDINQKEQPQQQQHDEKNVENQNIQEIKNISEQIIRKDTKKEISTKHVFKEIMKDTSKEKTKETPKEMKEPPKEIRRDTQKASFKEIRKELIKEEPKTGQITEKSTGKSKFEGEPVSPPASAFALFCKTYRGEKSPTSAWKRMNSDEKNKYEARVTKMKREYIVEFEKFLKSLTREQLTAFSNLRQSTKKKKINESDGDTSSNCSSESESEDTDSA